MNPTESALPPLSFAQERLWFLDRLFPGNCAYNVPLAIRVRGELNVGALEASLAEVVRRHEVLRTRFVETPDGPRQLVDANGRVPLTHVDLTSMPADQRASAGTQILRADARRVFDLQHGRVARCLVVRLSADEHLVQMTAHHIVTDAWSIAILMRETSEFYGAFTAGRTPSAGDLSIQYADYAVWQRRWAVGAKYERHMEYWRGTLNGVTALALLTDRPRPAVAPTFASAHVRLRIAREPAQRIIALGRELNATLFMTLLAGLYVTLWRLTGQRDIVVGTPVANRTRAELEGLIGLFLNSVAIRTRLHPSDAFADVVQRVRAAVLDAFAHQEVPFERIVDEVKPQRDMLRNPLFDVLFTVQNTPPPARQLGSLEHTQVETGTDTAKLDLAILLTETAGELNGSIEYRTELFDEETIQDLARHFSRILDAGSLNPHQRIRKLPLLDEPERRVVIDAFNQTTHPVDHEATVAELVERAAAATPNATAVVYEGEALSYAQLNVSADRLAARLQEIGVAPEVPVGVCLERSIDMAVTVLAVLKAGGAYVPLDPGHPSHRIRQIIDECELTRLVTDAALSAIDTRGLTVVDASSLRSTSDPPTRQTVAVPSSALAYIIYTSGSTGRPKGVSLPHSTLVNLVEWYRATMRCGGRSMQFASLGFDASFLELFGAWCAGGTAVIVPERTRIDPDRLIDLVATHGITQMLLPVVMLQRVAEALAGQEARFASVREIATAGEQMLLTPAVTSLLRRLPGCALHNLYGPSETHNATDLRLPEAVEGWPARPPLGYPIWNTQLYVLDEEMQPVPIGATGELYIGGTCVGRGYWRRPDLTAERFVPDPFRGAGQRLYRTGDLARRLRNGAVEFLGRSDDQVKIRGARVEPAEVEVALLSDDRVREAAILVHPEAEGAQLVAYVVLHDGASVRGVRQRLRDSLPEYMVPSHWVVLDALPLNRSGKVDRQRLPAAVEQTRASGASPASPAERAVAAIWSEVLQQPIDRIRLDDSFFDIGGHSLTVARVLSRIARDFRVDISVADMFRRPTLRDTVERLVQEYGDGELVNQIAALVVDPQVEVSAASAAPGAGRT